MPTAGAFKKICEQHKMSNLQCKTFRRWTGATDTITDESLNLAREWAKALEEKGLFAQVLNTDDIGQISEKVWHTIEPLSTLRLLRDKIAQDPDIYKQVRRLSKPGQKDAKWREGIRAKLLRIKISKEEIESDQVKGLEEPTEGLGVLQPTSDPNAVEIFLLFRAFVFYTSNSWDALWIKFKWRFPKIRLIFQDVRRWVGSCLARVVANPAILTFGAFILLFLAFMAVIISHQCVLWLTSGLLITYLLMYVLVVRKNHRWLSRAGISFIVLLYFTLAALIISLPSQLTDNRMLILAIPSFVVLLLMSWSIILAKSIREHYVILLIAGLISVALFEWLLGLGPDFIARFTAATFSSLGALGLLHLAQTKLPKEKKDPLPPLHEFLNQVTNAKSWGNPFKNWRWPNGLLFTILFSLALLLFFPLFALEQATCCPDNSNRPKGKDPEIQITYPSWLSNRDQSTIYATTERPTTLYFEPTDSSRLFFKMIETTSPLLPATPIPGGRRLTPSNLRVHSQWEIHTLFPDPDQSPDRWEFQVYTVNQKLGTIKQVKNCTISIRRLKLPFGLRGFLETQPFVTIVGILYGLAQTALQLWVGEKAFGDGV